MDGQDGVISGVDFADDFLCFIMIPRFLFYFQTSSQHGADQGGRFCTGIYGADSEWILTPTWLWGNQLEGKPS